VNKESTSTKLPALLAAGSFLLLLILGLFTSPTKNIGYVVFFFAGLFVLLVSLGHLLVRLQTGRVSLKSRFRIILISLFILLLLMIRSAQSLTWVDAVILSLIAAGMLFYSSRRSV
jgi:hypothetical protein